MNEYNDKEFHQRFHLTKSTVKELCDRLAPQVKRLSKNGLSVMDQILVTLRFLATGSFQLVCGDTANMSQASVSRCISSVLRAIIGLRMMFINFPTDLHDVKQKFYAIGSFPGTV
jgi:nuclease HARBI1